MVITTTLTVAYKLYKCYQAGEAIGWFFTNPDHTKDGIKKGLAIKNGKEHATDLVNMADSKSNSLFDFVLT